MWSHIIAETADNLCLMYVTPLTIFLMFYYEYGYYEEPVITRKSRRWPILVLFHRKFDILESFVCS